MPADYTQKAVAHVLNDNLNLKINETTSNSYLKNLSHSTHDKNNKSNTNFFSAFLIIGVYMISITAVGCMDLRG